MSFLTSTMGQYLNQTGGSPNGAMRMSSNGFLVDADSAYTHNSQASVARQQFMTSHIFDDKATDPASRRLSGGGLQQHSSINLADVGSGNPPGRISGGGVTGFDGVLGNAHAGKRTHSSVFEVPYETVPLKTSPHAGKMTSSYNFAQPDSVDGFMAAQGGEAPRHPSNGGGGGGGGGIRTSYHADHLMTSNGGMTSPGEAVVGRMSNPGSLRPRTSIHQNDAGIYTAEPALQALPVYSSPRHHGQHAGKIYQSSIVAGTVVDTQPAPHSIYGSAHQGRTYSGSLESGMLPTGTLGVADGYRSSPHAGKMTSSNFLLS